MSADCAGLGVYCSDSPSTRASQIARLECGWALTGCFPLEACPAAIKSLRPALATVETAPSNTPLAKTSNEVNKQTPTGEWIVLDTGIATVQAFTLYVDFSDSDSGQGVFFDDLSLSSLEDDDSPKQVRQEGLPGSNTSPSKLVQEISLAV
jgi:hypothetical protein